MTMTRLESKYYRVFWTFLLVLLALSGIVHLFDPDYDGVFTANRNDSSERGQTLYVSQGCPTCHGPLGKSPPVETYPSLAGQHEDYIYQQIVDIQSGARNNAQSSIMRAAMGELDADEARAIAQFLAKQ